MLRFGHGSLARFYRRKFNTAEYVHTDLNQRDTNEQQEDVGALHLRYVSYLRMI